MIRGVVVGLDGSADSRAAAEWAAREAKRRFLPLELVHVWEPVPAPMALAQAPRRSSGGASVFSARWSRTSSCVTPDWTYRWSRSPADPPRC
ncbi:universal stress protein [Streptomyces canus]|uniref:universal stress protein n=1 Tax=Streptomyces canus TaxID=58343 RepID=UPI003CF582B2